MTDDDLRARLAAIDPMAGRPVTPLTDVHQEHAMTTPFSRRTPLLLAAAASVAAVAVGVAVFTGGGSKPAAPVAVGKKTVLQLTDHAGNAAANSCMAYTAETVGQATYAFEGTATSVEGGTASFDVTHWYKGGTQAVVTITNDSGTEDGITFEAGKTYLVAADDTGVGPCSPTGVEDDNLKKLFEDAF